MLSHVNLRLRRTLAWTVLKTFPSYHLADASFSCSACRRTICINPEPGEFCKVKSLLSVQTNVSYIRVHTCMCVSVCLCMCVDDADAHVHPLTQRMEAACLIDFMDRDTDAVASVVCRPHLLDADGCLSSHPLWIHTCVLTAREAAWPAGGPVRRRTRASGLVSPGFGPFPGRRRLLPLVLRAAS